MTVSFLSVFMLILRQKRGKLRETQTFSINASLFGSTHESAIYGATELFLDHKDRHLFTDFSETALLEKFLMLCCFERGFFFLRINIHYVIYSTYIIILTLLYFL